MTKEELRALQEAVQEYVSSEGCTCCEDHEAHKLAARKLGKLLKFPIYDDGSGYNLYKVPYDDTND